MSYFTQLQYLSNMLKNYKEYDILSAYAKQQLGRKEELEQDIRFQLQLVFIAATIKKPTKKN